jgi:phospholipid/cholesterol/gamma-HCH transport system permease protein
VTATLASRVERIGAGALDGLAAARGLGGVLIASLRGCLRGRRHRPPGEIAHQMYVVGNRSLVFVVVTLAFIGMVMVYQSCLQLERITGDLSRIGPEFLKLVIQDFGPSLTALMLATRVGAGIAAEIGSMKVTEQIDALRMSGVTPIDYLIVPRLIASVVMAYALTTFGIAVAFAAGGMTAASSFGVNPRTFFDVGRVEWFDVGLGAIKTGAYGVAVPVVSGFCGLRAQGSSAGVGAATTAAVIGSSLAVILLNFAISGVGLALVGGTP